jgi:small-conductance mechanosensitive channel
MRPTIFKGLAALLLGGLIVAWTAMALAQAPPAPANALAAAAAAPAKAASPPPAAPPPSVSASLAAAQITLILQNQAQSVSNDSELAAMGARASAIQSRAQAQVAAASAALAGLAPQLQRLAPHPRRRPSAADKAKQAPLLARQAALHNQLQQAQQVVAAAAAAFDQIAERRREGFSARVLQRSPSPLSPDFWTSLASDAGDDMVRLGSVSRQAVESAIEAAEPRGLLGLAAGLAIAWVLAFPARRRLVKLGRRKAGKAVHPGVARTGAALWVVATDIAMPTLAAASLRLAVQWGGLLSSAADDMAASAVVAVAWGAAILALSRVLATDVDARQRLLRLPDDAARRIQPLMVAVALVTGAGFMLIRLNYVVGASLAATIAANCFLSLAYAAVAGLILVSFGRGGFLPAAAGPSPPTTDPRSPAWTLVSLLLTTAILVTLAAVLTGYTTLAAITSSQIFWLGIIAAITYLLLRFVDDAAAAAFREKGWAARTLHLLFNFRRSTVRQVGVLTSAALQLVILIAALSAALTPFGEGGQLLFADLGRMGGSVKLGSAIISPTAIAAGLAALVIGMMVVHFVQRWITHRYLPVTDWDVGVRNSITTGVGYVGAGVALLVALTAMGLNFSQIALVASALSVGIGFGLQQIVQNFISGVILLVERPVKVGDWVSVGGVEGDVRRIRVRATEIQTFDRSTVIVPNANLITNPVQNNTSGDPRGRVQLHVSIAKHADASKAKDLVLRVVRGESRVLGDPAPQVFIDSLASSGAVNFTCIAFLATPRDAQTVRSDLYFKLLAAFQESGVALAGAA